MSKSQNVAFVRYEYIVYTHILETYNISEILLTKDDFVDVKSVSDQVKWIPVVKINVDIVDTTIEEAENSDDTSISKIKNRICGLFDAEPLDWKYAKVTVGDDTNTKHNVAIARIPVSPIVPVIFDMNK
ncbi:MAG: hypothetical protein ACYSR1_07850 [Planctomycetota bacterium]|jgi:hypothetical protein